MPGDDGEVAVELRYGGPRGTGLADAKETTYSGFLSFMPTSQQNAYK